MGNEKYRYKCDFYPVDADTAGEELERIEREHGKIRPKTVVDESRPTDACLHPVFEWRDDIAAEKYRCGQAKNLMSNLVRVSVYVSGKQEPVRVRTMIRAFSNVSPAGKEGAYVNTETAMQNEEYRAIILDNAKREMTQLRRKYEDLVDLKAVAHEVFWA